MANIDNRGFRPADRKPSEELLFLVDAANDTNMFVGDVIDAAAAGAVNVSDGSTPTQSVGTVVALYDSNGIPIGHPNSSVSTKYLPSTTAGKALVALALPGRRFIAQAISGKTPAEADIFATSDLTATAGDTTISHSNHELKYTALNTEGQFLILGRVRDPGNAYGEHVDLYVTFNESIFGPNGKSVGV